MAKVEQDARAAVGGVTAALAEGAATLEFSRLPKSVVELSKQCLLDWFAVTLAGTSEPLVQILVDDVREQGGNPQATLVGRPERVSTQQAALVNGAASHALDYDDVHRSITGHPTVTVVPGLLALAESRGATGAEFVAAFTAGYETACRVGDLVNPSHYERGFHATATIGSLGSAAACGRLLGLDADGMAVAFGIAATQAAGLKSMFGTMCKPLHAGKAAQNGSLAASLAQRGFDSRSDVLDCQQGFADVLSDARDPEAAVAEVSGGYHIRANLFKFHAACYLTHAAIESARRLREEHGISPEQVSEVEVRVHDGCDSVCNIFEPKTGLEAKFSLRLTTAFALAGLDTRAIETYSEANCVDPVLVGFRDKVVVVLEPSLDRMVSSVTVRLRDGDVFTASHDAGVPADDLAEQRVRLESKFHSLVDPILGEEASERLVGLVQDLENLDSLHEMLALTGGR